MAIGPFNIDVTARASDYKGLDKDQLLVHSMFPTLQGEGPFAGERALFIRLAGCNFGGKGVAGPGCPFCDTRFSLSEGGALSFRQISDYIRNNHPGHRNTVYRGVSRLVVVTGGEPFLQPNITDFTSFLLQDNDEVMVQFETNGTCPWPGVFEDYQYRTYIVLSPKVPELLESTRTATYTKIPESMYEAADCLKILISGDPNSPYYEPPAFAFDFQASGRPVYLSPINEYMRAVEPGAVVWGQEEPVLRQTRCAINYARAARLCIEHGFTLSLQQHVFASIP